MLEPETLDGVRELDVDAEIVGVQLEPVVGGESGVLLTSIESVAIGPSKLSFQ